MKINISTVAKELGKSLDIISERVQAQVQAAVKQLSLNTYSEAIRLANQRLNTARENYINSLKYSEDSANNVYTIYLHPDGSGKFYEQGWDSFSMIPGLVNGPKSRVTKGGVRYNIVPFRKKGTVPKGATSPIADTASAIQKIIKDSSLEKIEKEVLGGKITTYKGIEDPMLKGLTRVTKEHTSKTGKITRSSQYFIFRMVTENSKGWKHPGHQGVHIFKDLETYVRDNMERILKEIL